MKAGGASRSPKAHCEPTDEGFGRRLALGSNIQRARARSGAGRPTARGPLRLVRPRRPQLRLPRPRRPRAAGAPGPPLPARELQAIADRLVPADRPADWTAALMDIGASVCRPRRPDCAACPLAGEGRYASIGLIEPAADPRPRRRAA